jgi:hypothetical protein
VAERLLHHMQRGALRDQLGAACVAHLVQRRGGAVTTLDGLVTAPSRRAQVPWRGRPALAVARAGRRA